MAYKLCICISGGLDSFTAYHWARLYYCPKNGIDFEKEVVLLSVEDTDSPYWQKEIQVMSEIYIQDKPEWKRVQMYAYGRLSQTDDHVVLGRNAVIASVAVALAPEVWICGTKYEDNKEMYDKNFTFWKLISQALTQACGYKRDIETQVLSPFQGGVKLQDIKNEKYVRWEKDEMIFFLEYNIIVDWRKTTSCFHHHLERCGECVVCGKRFIYEKYAELKYGIHYDLDGLDLEQTYDINPYLNNKFLHETMQKMLIAEQQKDFSRYHKERIEKYKRVMDWYANDGKNSNRKTIQASGKERLSFAESSGEGVLRPKRNLLLLKRKMG